MTKLQGFVKQYEDSLESYSDLRGYRPIDVLKPLTGGGVGLDAAMALGEYLAWCYYKEGRQNHHNIFENEQQREILEFLMAHIYSCIQIYRREGKSHLCGGLVGTLYVGNGLPMVNAMPTLLQGSRLIFRLIRGNLIRVSKLKECADINSRAWLHDSQTEMFLPNAGQCITLSADKGAEKEGYDAAYVLLDEAHKAHKSTLGIFQPFTNRAVAAGIGRFAGIGVGEFKDSAIDQMRFPEADSKYNYACLRIKDTDVTNPTPQQTETFEREKATLPAEGEGSYAQMFGLEPVTAGTGKIFPEGIYKRAAVLETHSQVKRVASWDSAKRVDDSRMSILEKAPSAKAEGGWAINVIETWQAPKGMSYPKQARHFAKLLKDYYPDIHGPQIAVEYNGVGDGAADNLNELMPKLIYFWKDEFWTDYYHTQMQVDTRLGTFGVANNAQRKRMEALTYERDDQGTYKWEHSDDTASIIPGLSII